ncbi:hypothetical protein TWF281_008180 [Arthrobotrys megalospora]
MEPPANVPGGTTPAGDSLTSVTEELSHCYYSGLPSRPRLIATTRPHPFDPPFTLYPYPTEKEIHALRAGHPIVKVWDFGVGNRFQKGLNEMQVDWTSIDVVHLPNNGDPPGPAIVWIGVTPNSLELEDGAILAAKCQHFLDENLIPDTFVEIRESVIITSAGFRFMDLPRPPEVEEPPYSAPHRDSFTTALGMTICDTSTPHAIGSGGFFISAGGDDKNVYLVTARHVVCADTIESSKTTIERWPQDWSQPRVDISILGRQLDKKVVKVEKDIETLNESIDISNKRIQRPINNEEQARVRKRAQEALPTLTENLAEIQALRREMTTHLADVKDRVIGELVWAPPISFSNDENGHTLDIAVIKIDVGTLDINNYGGNIINLTIKYKKSEMAEMANLHPSEVKSRLHSIPSDRLIDLRDQTPCTEFSAPSMTSADGEKCTVVFKNGATTGVTFGRANPVRSTKRYLFYGLEKISKEWCIISSSKVDPDDRDDRAYAILWVYTVRFSATACGLDIGFLGVRGTSLETEQINIGTIFSD